MWKSVVSHRRRYRPSIRPLKVFSLKPTGTFNSQFGTFVAIHHTCRTVFVTERFTGTLEVVPLKRSWVDLRFGFNQICFVSGKTFFNCSKFPTFEFL